MYYEQVTLLLGIVTQKVHFMGSSRTMGVNRYSKECGKSWVRAPCQVDPSNVYKVGQLLLLFYDEVVKLHFNEMMMMMMFAL
jgi:hypothetical protein